jgi:benzodiazapine receptor
MMSSAASFRAKASSLVFWLIVTFAAAAVGAIASINAAEFYLQLDRPGWAPPAGVFGPVWTALYCLIAISAWLVWRERRFGAGLLPYVLFFTQLMANALWSWLFFAWHRGQWAFIEVLLLLMLIVATQLSFKAINPLAAWLLLPYLAWVCFASVLTYTVWQRNPDLL